MNKTYLYSIEHLSTAIHNLNSVQQNPKIELFIHFRADLDNSDFRNFFKEDNQMREADRMSIIKKVLTTYKKYITGLSLIIYGDEIYLLHSQFHLPILNFLSVSPHMISYQRVVPAASSPSCQMLQYLLVAYQENLKQLEVDGYWKLDGVSDSENYSLEALERLNISQTLSPTIKSLASHSGQFITTLEIEEGLNGNLTGDECYMPNLKNLKIDSDSMEYYEIIKRNRPRP